MSRAALLVQMTRPALFARIAAEPITVSCYPAIQRSPQKHAPGEMGERRHPPEFAQASREIAHRLGPPMLSTARIDDTHFLH